MVKSGKCTLFNRNLKGFLQVRFRVFEAYFGVPRLGHYKSTFLFWRSKIGVQKQGVKSVKWWFLYLNLHKAVLRGFLTGFERVLWLKGRYIVTFGEEAVRGPQKWSKMSIFLLKMTKNHQKSRNLLKCASKQRVQIHGFLKTTKRS